MDDVDPAGLFLIALIIFFSMILISTGIAELVKYCRNMKKLKELEAHEAEIAKIQRERRLVRQNYFHQFNHGDLLWVHYMYILRFGHYDPIMERVVLYEGMKRYEFGAVDPENFILLENKE